MAKMDDNRFDELLGKAFTQQYKNETESEPADRELEEKYPLTEKQLSRAKRLYGKKNKPLWMTYARRVAAVAVCVVSVGFALMMLDPGIRGTVGGTVTQWIDDMVGIDFGKSAEYEKIDITKTEIGYIPEGFAVAEDRVDETFVSKMYFCEETGEYILIDITESSDISILTEYELHELEKMKIQGYDAYVTYSDSQRQGSVAFGNQYFTVAVSGMTDRDELIKIAENIVLKD